MERNISTAQLAPRCVCNLANDRGISANNAAVAVLHVLSGASAVISNAAVIVTVAKTPSLWRPANILMCGLAFGDFMVGLLAQPVMLTLLIMQNAGTDCCTYKAGFEVFLHVMPFFIFGSLFHICLISWDRYKAVSNAVRYRTGASTRQTAAITVAAWIVWIAGITFLKAVVQEAARKVLILFALVVLIMIVAISQVATLRSIHRANIEIAPVPSAVMFRREKKMAVTVYWILGSLLLSALPFLVLNALAPSRGGQPDHVFATPWVRLAICLSSSINPVIYFWRHGKLRRAAFGLIGR